MVLYILDWNVKKNEFYHHFRGWAPPFPECHNLQCKFGQKTVQNHKNQKKDHNCLYRSPMTSTPDHRATFLKLFQDIPILTISGLPLAIYSMAKMAILGHFGHNVHGQWQPRHGQYGYVLKEFSKCSSVVWCGRHGTSV